ncbi:MAG: hypothetical protein DCC75_00125 [Proteobacteria bacterium]|nr:MAG: hypothetical protein DCC75_00125 [Pseudomonadota bacterium]
MFSFFHKMNTLSGSTDRGAAILECALVLPVVLILMYGVLDIGLQLSQVPWLAETAYQASLSAGRETTQLNAEAAAQTRLNRLISGNQHFMTRAGRYSHLVPTFTWNQGNRTVSMSINVSLAALSGLTINLPVGINIVAPLVRSASQFVGSLGAPANPNATFTCSGVASPSAPTACVQCISGPPPSCIRLP